MRTSKWIRIAGLVASASLIAGGLSAAPALAAKKCGAYKPAEPQSDSGQTAEALDAKTIKVTDKYSEAKPLVIEYSHGPAFWFIADPTGAQAQSAAVEDTVFYNIQIDTKAKYAGVSIRQEWDPNSPDDMDLYLYDKYGAQIGSSGEFNAVAGAGLGTGNGGLGYEQVLGMGVADCTGITIESRAFTSPGRDMKLIIWVGAIS